MAMTRMRSIGIHLAVGLVAWAATAAAVEPAIGFTSQMVLQQGLPLPVHGKATPGERVQVAFGIAQAEATADATGRWQATLPPQEASRQPRQLLISGDHDRVVLEDVLVGEVWLCAGQSNML